MFIELLLIKLLSLLILLSLSSLQIHGVRQLVNPFWSQSSKSIFRGQNIKAVGFNMLTEGNNTIKYCDINILG
jgi:hypothetical protein